MSFTSIAFLFFLPVVVCGYYVCPRRFRWAVLLAASCYFYMAFVPKYLLVLLFLVVVDYLVALMMERTAGKQRRWWLVAGILATLSVLFFFKYFNFFDANFALLAHLLDWNYSAVPLKLLLPLGLSFHTFQSLSYLIEVYRGKYVAERHIGLLALFVMFFPQLIAGPIERPAHLLPQLKRPAGVRFATFESGLRLVAWGFFKKLVIADQIATAVNYIYSNATHATGPSVVSAMVFFAIQLYADFSGYTDIARGSARLFGIELVLNFKQPYFSRSIAEFWRRWHISLSSWFRDYVYTPLIYAMPRMSLVWLYACILVTFLVTGFWHGAGWTFIVMGGLFGTYIVVGLVTKKWREVWVPRSGLSRVPKVHATLQIFLTFLLVCVAQVFFRAPSLTVAFELLGRLATGWYLAPLQYVHAYVLEPFWMLGIGRNTLLVALVCTTVLFVVEYIEQSRPVGALLDRQSIFVRSFAYTSLVFAILMFGSFSAPSFIYFQF